MSCRSRFRPSQSFPAMRASKVIWKETADVARWYRVTCFSPSSIVWEKRSHKAKRSGYAVGFCHILAANRRTKQNDLSVTVSGQIAASYKRRRKPTRSGHNRCISKKKAVTKAAWILIHFNLQFKEKFWPQIFFTKIFSFSFFLGKNEICLSPLG